MLNVTQIENDVYMPNTMLNLDVNKFFNVCLATRLWENDNTFGKLEKATTSDYKNPGYYTIKVRTFCPNSL